MPLNRGIFIFLVLCVIIITGVPVHLAFSSSEYKKIKALEAEHSSKQDMSEELVLKPEIDYNAGGLKDPFSPYYYRKEEDKVITKQTHERISKPVAKRPLPSLSVRGVVWGSEMPHAIVNEQVVTIGDIVEGVEIVAINKEGIEVRFEDAMYTVNSPGQESSSSFSNPLGGGRSSVPKQHFPLQEGSFFSPQKEDEYE